MRTESDTKAGSLSSGGAYQIPERVAAFQVFNQVKVLRSPCLCRRPPQDRFSSNSFAFQVIFDVFNYLRQALPVHFANRLVLREIEWNQKVVASVRQGARDEHLYLFFAGHPSS